MKLHHEELITQTLDCTAFYKTVSEGKRGDKNAATAAADDDYGDYNDDSKWGGFS